MAIFSLTRVALMATAFAASLATAQAADISGAGATFPYPVYAKWAQTYKGATGTGVNYQSIGSGGGIKQIKAKTVDFGASDKPLKPDELGAAGLYQFPTVVGGVVPVMNLPGIRPGQIKLTGALLGDIYLGKITRWNAPEIAALNRGVPLPNLPITVVHRSDGSGTSFLFTSYLAMKNPEWGSKVGASDSVQWPTGLGGKGNDGVAAIVGSTPGTIGYVELNYAIQKKIPHASVINKSGKPVKASPKSVSAAGAGAVNDMKPGSLAVPIWNQPGEEAYPISSLTYLIVYNDLGNVKSPEQAKALAGFLAWALSTEGGQALAEGLDYAPLAPAVADKAQAAVKALTYNGAATN